MSTQPTPVVAVAKSATTPSILEKYIAFFKAHERLLIFVACLFVAFHCYSKGIDYLDRHASTQAKVDQVVVNSDAVTNKQLAGELALLRAQVAADTAKSVALIQQAQAAAKQQQQIDQTLPLPDLASRWTYLADLQPGDITSTADNKLLLTDAGSRATVKQLENIPAMTETIVQTQAELAGCNQVSAKKDDVIVGLNKQVADVTTARADDAKAAKIAQRKSWVKGFKWGFVGGFISGLFVGHSV